ncbi:MAG: PKD domain-containing protein [Thermoplasmata archaeon]
MAFDQADHYEVLFGGQSSSAHFLNDTWIFAGGHWQNITDSAGPGPIARYGMVMTYDAEDGYVLAFGGTSWAECPGGPGGSVCNDTWSFSHGRWHQIDARGGPLDYSDALLSFAIADDLADGYVLLTDGQGTWRYSGGVWTPFCGSNCTNFIPGPSGVGGVVAYDSENREVVFYGGAGGNETWTFSDGKWTNVTSLSGMGPSARSGQRMVEDGSDGGVLLFGGYRGSSFLNDTWTFVNGTWTNITRGTAPPGRYGQSLAENSSSSLILMFGGDREYGASGNFNDTWSWGSNPPIAGLVIDATPSSPDPRAVCTFDASFRGGEGPFDYSWKFGDGGSSMLANPSHEFSSIGYYSVRLWLNDSEGHESSASLRLHVYNPLSISSLLATPNPAVLGEQVNFSGAAAGGTPPYTFSWTFGDGGTGGNLTEISHVYETNGPFEVELSVHDSIGGTAKLYLNVTIGLEALAAAKESSGTAPLRVDFVGQGEGGQPPYSFDWNFGDASPVSTLQDPTHTYNGAGNYEVALQVQDSQGNQSTTEIIIEVTGVPPSQPTSGSWFLGFALVSVVAGLIAVSWGIVRVRDGRRRREGEQWINELSGDHESPRTPGNQ